MKGIQSKLNLRTGNLVFILMIILLFCFNSFIVKAQKVDWQPTHREIVVSNKDTLVKTYILLQNIKPKISNNLTYYWFGQNCINHNLGGYSGQLLHGEYSVFDKNNKLVTKGNFEKGLKNGIWKTWHPNGMLKTTSYYDHGLLQGYMIIYDSNGFIKDTLKYKNGSLIIKKEKEKGNFFHFLKLKNHSNDSIQSDTTRQVNSIKTDNEQ